MIEKDENQEEACKMNCEAINKNSISSESCLSKVEARDGASFFRQVLFGHFLERQKVIKEKFICQFLKRQKVVGKEDEKLQGLEHIAQDKSLM